MMNKHIYTRALLLLTGVHLPVLAGELIDETRSTSSDPVVVLELVNGQVSIIGWDRNEFRITGELSDAADGFELRSSANNIHFEENIERRNWNWRNYSRGDWADLEIRVPFNSILRYEGVNTDIEVSELTANTEIEVVNGNIDASDLSGVITLETTNGSIDTNNLDGRISIDTTNGSIRDRNSKGSRLSFDSTNGSIRSDSQSSRVTVEAVNGSIDLRLGNIDELEVSTVNGGITAEAAMNRLAHIDISSVGGRIELALPGATSSSFHIETSVGGDIRNRLNDQEPVRKSRYTRAQELDMVLGNGDGDVNIYTVHGNITLENSD